MYIYSFRYTAGEGGRVERAGRQWVKAYLSHNRYRWLVTAEKSDIRHGQQVVGRSISPKIWNYEKQRRARGGESCSSPSIAFAKRDWAMSDGGGRGGHGGGGNLYVILSSIIFPSLAICWLCCIGCCIYKSLIGSLVGRTTKVQVGSKVCSTRWNNSTWRDPP
jgi:hypothetical protein